MSFMTGLRVFLISVLLISASAFGGDYVLEDGSVGMTKQELEYIVSHWTPQMQQAAANDDGDRIALLNRALASKKIAADADRMTAADDPDRYWKLQLLLRNTAREFAVKIYMEDLVVPDMSELAQEVYKTEKDKYASVPESRYVSHILFLCQAGKCERDSKRPLADEVLAKLNSGADFSELAKEYSDDAGTAAKGGVYDHWMVRSDAGVEPYFLQATFETEAVGDLTLVDTRFGIHIIRLDKIRPLSYLSFEEIESKIIATLENEYRKLAAKEFDAKYRITDDALIDGPAMDEIFSPYKTAQ